MDRVIIFVLLWCFPFASWAQDSLLDTYSSIELASYARSTQRAIWAALRSQNQAAAQELETVKRALLLRLAPDYARKRARPRQKFEEALDRSMARFHSDPGP